MPAVRVMTRDFERETVCKMLLGRQWLTSFQLPGVSLRTVERYKKRIGAWPICRGCQSENDGAVVTVDCAHANGWTVRLVASRISGQWEVEGPFATGDDIDDVAITQKLELLVAIELYDKYKALVMSEHGPRLLMLNAMMRSEREASHGADH